MKTVKVKMLSDEVNRAGDPLPKDSIQDLREDSAEYWTKRGKAELVKEEPKGKRQDDAAKAKAEADKKASDDAAVEAKRVADELAAAAEQKAKEDAAKAKDGGPK